MKSLNSSLNLIVAGALVLSLVACGQNKSDKKDGDYLKFGDGVYQRADCEDDSYDYGFGNTVERSASRVFVIQGQTALRGYIEYKGKDCKGEIDYFGAGAVSLPGSKSHVKEWSFAIEDNHTWNDETEIRYYEVVRTGKRTFFIDDIGSDFFDENGKKTDESYKSALRYSDWVLISRGESSPRLEKLAREQNIDYGELPNNRDDINNPDENELGSKDELQEYASYVLKNRTYIKLKEKSAAEAQILAKANEAIELAIQESLENSETEDSENTDEESSDGSGNSAESVESSESEANKEGN